MTVGMILELINIVEDEAEVIIRDKDTKVIAQGNWYTDAIQEHVTEIVESFTWQDDDKVFIDLKEVD